MKKVLITGANSYIGTSFERYVKAHYAKALEVDTIDMEADTWRRYDFAPYDVVFHVAGIAHADVNKVSEETKEKYYNVNTKLAVETAMKAKDEGVKQFVFMSSMIVYGSEEHITEATKPQPVNFYGDSKWQAEQGILALQNESFQVSILRPPMIYGKDSKGNYPMLSKLAGSLPAFPKVGNRRSMLYIENLCEFLCLLMVQTRVGIFFPQNAELVNTSRLVELIAKANGHKIWVTSLLSPFVMVGKKMPGKIGNLCRKAFGSCYYESALSQYEWNYQCYSLEDSIKRTERGSYEKQKKSSNCEWI